MYIKLVEYCFKFFPITIVFLKTGKQNPYKKGQSLHGKTLTP